jgi:UDP-4-amino-4,6-dideoxy-N-acetyl-beta-L-altrosamine N-acetyltransferase
MDMHFRNITEDDLEMILRWRTMPEVSTYMYTDFEPDMDQQRKWYQSISADPRRLDWVIAVDGEDVGLVSIVAIDTTNRRAELGWYLASPSVRGKGIGKSVEMNFLRYVFEDLNLHKLCVEALVGNESGIRVHEKCGAKVEGTRRDQIYKNGKYHDIVELGILRPDWERDIKDRVEYVRAKIDAVPKEVVTVRSGD